MIVLLLCHLAAPARDCNNSILCGQKCLLLAVLSQLGTFFHEAGGHVGDVPARIRRGHATSEIGAADVRDYTLQKSSAQGELAFAEISSLPAAWRQRTGS